MENFYPVIIDLGQFSTKIGFGGENEPRHTLFTITGTPKYTALEMHESKQLYIGNEIIDSLGLYKINHPIDNGGEIVDWTHFKAIIDYIFYLLRVDSSLCKVLLTTNPFMSIDSKKRLFELFIEKYQSSYYPIRGSLLTMYSGGFETGLVIDFGAAHIRITPIYKSFILQHAVRYLPLGGNVIDEFMGVKLQQLGMSIDSSVQKNIVRVLKERACFTSLDFQADIKNNEKFKTEYALPDSSVITLGVERFLVPELIFQPQLMNIESDSLPKAVVDCVQQCDLDIRRELLQSIFITGGSSLFPCLDVRLKREIEFELNQLNKVSQEVRVIAPQGRALSNWVGGSILSMIPEFQKNWMSRKRYYQEGITEEMLNA